MSRRLGFLALLLLVPVLAPAPAAQQPSRQKPSATEPEALLSADCLFYLRFDGLESHRKAYEQTAFGQVMKGDLGNFVDYVGKLLTEKVAPMMLGDVPVGGRVPDEMLKLQSFVTQLPHLLRQLNRHGIVLGVEVIDLDPPRIQLTVIFPNGGEQKTRDAIFAVGQLIASAAEIKVKETKQGTRTVFELEGADPIKFAWWQEGNHVVLTVGTEPAAHVLALVQGGGRQRANLTTNAHYKQLMGFDRYETIVRGFIDFERGLKMARAKIPPAGKVIDTLGLDGLRTVTLYAGFEGKTSRSTVVMHVGQERKGLLKLTAASEGLDPDKLPAFPPDASTISVMQLDLGQTFDLVVQVIEMAVGLISPDAAGQVQAGLGQVNQMVGFDIRKDLIGSLGETIITYNSPGEGPFSLGTATLIKVKDKKKLLSSLDKTFKAISRMGGKDIQVTSREYNGVEIYTVNIPFEGMFLAPSYAVHDDWLVVGMYPQVVQGYALRSTGKYKTWKPSEYMQKAIADARKGNPKAKITSLSESDPRPTVKLVLSLAPIGGALLNSFMPGTFDVSMLPNAQAVTEHLFPNVVITIDEGSTIRTESYESLAIPDLTGADIPAALMLFWTSARGGAATFERVERAVPVPVPPPVQRKEP